MARDTIYAVSSGPVPAGVAVIRVSGPQVRFGLETMTGSVPKPRFTTLRPIRDRNGLLLDRGLVLFFAGPASFTGEDVAELHVHGGRAVVAAVLAALAELPGHRAAEAGEFTRRAFENGRADLTEVEGLSDLIAAETEAQRRQALQQAEGGLASRLRAWSGDLLQARAMLESGLDFVDEEDVPASVIALAMQDARRLAREMDVLLSASAFGERVRSGFDVVLLGAPNVGKSSLLNALAEREAAIVTAEPGTTRDLIEVALDIDGYAVTLVDTAGLRDAAGLVEREGIERARKRSAGADLVLLLYDGVEPLVEPPPGVPRLNIRTKIDQGDRASGGIAVSAVSGEGLDELRRAIGAALGLADRRPDALIVRERQRQGITAARDALAAIDQGQPPELIAEELRRAADALGRVAGRTCVEDLLGAIFSSFCIGK
jgi:tRNA modification GTPase